MQNTTQISKEEQNLGGIQQIQNLGNMGTQGGLGGLPSIGLNEEKQNAGMNQGEKYESLGSFPMSGISQAHPLATMQSMRMGGGMGNLSMPMTALSFPPMQNYMPMNTMQMQNMPLQPMQAQPNIVSIPHPLLPQMNHLNPLTPFNLPSMSPINPISQMGQMSQMSQMSQMNQMNQMNQMSQMNQMNQINQMNQMGQMNQMNQMGQMNGMAPVGGLTTLNPLSLNPLTLSQNTLEDPAHTGPQISNTVSSMSLPQRTDPPSPSSLSLSHSHSQALAIRKGKRRSKHQQVGRHYICGCGKTYLSYPALYTHVKTKHHGVNPVGTNTPTFCNGKGRGRGRPRKVHFFFFTFFSFFFFLFLQLF